MLTYKKFMDICEKERVKLLDDLVANKEIPLDKEKDKERAVNHALRRFISYLCFDIREVLEQEEKNKP